MFPSNIVPPVPYDAGYSDTNKLSQQIQDMKLSQPMCPVPSLSPQHRMQTTTVTYSGSPQVTYPYSNNSCTMPKSSINSSSSMLQHNSSAPDFKMTSPEQRYHPVSSVRTSISNGHSDSKHPTDHVQLKQQPSPVFQPRPYPSLPHQPLNNSQQHQLPSVVNSPSSPSMNINPQQYQLPNSPISPSMNNNPQQYRFPNSPSSTIPSVENSSPNLGFNQMQQPSYQNMAPPGGSPLQLSPPQYSGIPPSPAGMWPNQQYPRNYNYSQPNHPMPGQDQAPGRLNLDHMPSLIEVREGDQKLRSGYYVSDVKRQIPPLVTTNFIVQDRGVCSPRFIRSTLNCLPNQPDMLKQTGIPFAITLSPMAALNDGESALPVALYREQGPLRCKRCKAYICSFMNFLEGGRSFQCAFCKVMTEVPQDYFCFLDGIGERTDKYHRPELCLGSYEFLATKEYCRNDQLPNPPAYIFMIEVSSATFRNGLVPLLCENMKSVLQCLKNEEQIDTSKLRVGFVSYNNVLHFYNMKKNLMQPHIMVLSDVHNAFVPLCDGFLVTLSEAEALVDCLMEHIPRLFINEPASEVILGPVIQVGLETLKNANCSGKLIIFHSTIPNADAPGKLSHREGQKLLGTEKQKTVLSPQHEFYYQLAKDCVTAGCAVDLFLFPNAYIDIASIAPLCRHTGGQLYKYTYFQSHIDGDRFLDDLERNITTPTAFDAVLRVRTSTGISPVFYYGNFYMSNNTDVELCALDSHKAITIEMAYDEKLTENETVYIQAALLYTSVTGERRIRVHNLAIPTSVGIPDAYKFCELDTIINYFAKFAVKQVLEVPPQQIKNNLVSRAVKMLSCYRKHCSPATSSMNLTLPDSLKLLPLSVNCILKSDAINGGSEMTMDDRSFAMLAVNTMDVRNTAFYFYPTLIPLHNIDLDSDAKPRSIRCSNEKLNDNGAYLLENGIYMFLWIGQAIHPDWLQNVFGVQSANQVNKQKTSLPELDTPLSKKISQIIKDLEEGRQWYMRLHVVVQGDKLESIFRQFLVEDKGVDGSMSYVEFLCHLHQEVSKNL